MIRHSLATLWLKLRRPKYRGISPILIVIILSTIADGVFWYYGFNSSSQDQSAFIQLAAGWTVAVMTLVAGWFITARGEARSSHNTQRTAYKEFMLLSDKLVAARASFVIAESARDDAHNEYTTANEQAILNPNDTNLNARLVTLASLKKADEVLRSKTAIAQDLLEAYSAAETTVTQIAAPSVRPAFEQFRKCPPEDTTARARARSRFAQAANLAIGRPETASP